MKIIIQFVRDVPEGRLLLSLKNVKKRNPAFREHLFEIKEGEYLLKSEEGKVEAKFNYLFDKENHLVDFDGLKGILKDEIERMLVFDFPEKVREKCFVYNKEKDWKLYYDMSEWFLIEKKRFFKVGRDREKLIETELGHIPKEIKRSS